MKQTKDARYGYISVFWHPFSVLILFSVRRSLLNACLKRCGKIVSFFVRPDAAQDTEAVSVTLLLFSERKRKEEVCRDQAVNSRQCCRSQWLLRQARLAKGIHARTC